MPILCRCVWMAKCVCMHMSVCVTVDLFPAPNLLRGSKKQQMRGALAPRCVFTPVCLRFSLRIYILLCIIHTSCDNVRIHTLSCSMYIGLSSCSDFTSGICAASLFPLFSLWCCLDFINSVEGTTQSQTDKIRSEGFCRPKSKSNLQK